MPIEFKIYSAEECKEFIKRNENDELEFSHELCSRKITMSKHLELHLAEFKADPIRYNYNLKEIENVMDQISKVIFGVSIKCNIFLLPEMMSIVRAVDVMKPPEYCLIMFAYITPFSSDHLPWLLSHEVSHFIHNEILGITEDPNNAWENREHEKFANMFAGMILKRVENAKK